MNIHPVSNVWSLCSDGMTISAAQAGVTEIIRHRATQSTETCTVRTEGTAFDAAPLFIHGSRVKVLRDGVPWFVGRVTGMPGSGDGHTEGLSYDLSGPWWHLENLVCQQTWVLRGGETTALLSRLVLGQSLAGGRLTSGQVIVETLQHAIDSGAPFQIGVVEPAAILPLDELRDVTCAEVIRKVLRWHPDCVAWFDHATEPVPTFHCRARGNLPQTTFAVGRAPLTAVRGITKRTDLVTPAVVLHYETVNGDSTDVVTDAAPAGATGREFGALVATISSGSATPTDPVAFSLAQLAPTGGNPPTLSLAQTLYHARSVPAYSGSLVLVEPEAGGVEAGPGTTLNLTNAACAEWATMQAVVVEDETRVASGTTSVRFGPAEHLGTVDLASALNGTRPGVGGREAGSPAAMQTPSSAARVSGRIVPAGG